MKVPFKGGYKITQGYGENPDYYKQFGLKSHEGVDLIPEDSDWDVYAIEGGEVVRDVDDPRIGGAYGNLVVILNRETRRAWWYAHNVNNMVSIGDVIKAGQKIARMGATGNVTGPHLHLGLRKSDKNGNALNTNNGNLGFIDPIPVMKELEVPEDPLTDFEEEIKRLNEEIDGLRASRDRRKLQYSELEERCITETKAKQQTIEQQEKQISLLNEQLTNNTIQYQQLQKGYEAEVTDKKTISEAYSALKEESEKLSKENKKLKEDRKKGIKQYSRFELMKAVIFR